MATMSDDVVTTADLREYHLDNCFSRKAWTALFAWIDSERMSVWSSCRAMRLTSIIRHASLSG